jgi:large subunit ribosomal protein L15
MVTLNALKRIGERSGKRVGRGQSSGRGKTSGRGTKGQSARAGNKKRPEYRDIIKKLPKRRGFGKNRARTVNPLRPQPVGVPLARLGTSFDGSEVTLASLKQEGVIGREVRAVKIIGNEVSKKLVIKGCAVSPSAKAAIEKAGGSIA